MDKILDDAVNNLLDDLHGFRPISEIEIWIEKMQNILSDLPTFTYVQNAYGDTLAEDYKRARIDLADALPDHSNYEFNDSTTSSYKPSKATVQRLIDAMDVASSYQPSEYGVYLETRRRRRRSGIRLPSRIINPANVFVRCQPQHKSKLFYKKKFKNGTTKIKPLPAHSKKAILKNARIRNALDKCIRKLKRAKHTVKNLGLTKVPDDCVDESIDRLRSLLEALMQKRYLAGKSMELSRPYIKNRLGQIMRACMIKTACQKIDCKARKKKIARTRSSK